MEVPQSSRVCTRAQAQALQREESSRSTYFKLRSRPIKKNTTYRDAVQHRQQPKDASEPGDSELFIRTDQTTVPQAAELTDVSSKDESWVAIDEFGKKVEIVKQEHTILSYDARENATKIAYGLERIVALCESFKVKRNEEFVKYNEEVVKYNEGRLELKNLYNQLQEAKGNIRVFCRCRPLNNDEVSAGLDFDSTDDRHLWVPIGGSKKLFEFDRVYTPADGQADVYKDASPMVTSVLDGYDVCIFAYGQTGTGKTFTMEGTEQDRGVNYRTLDHLFRMVEERKETYSYTISISVLEVYNDEIRDLLAPRDLLTLLRKEQKLEVRKVGEFNHVAGLVEIKVNNINEAWKTLKDGSNARAVGSNNVNEHSSRSHCLICIMVRAKDMTNDTCTTSKLWLVDLAGSERLDKTKAQGQRLTESKYINKSLSTLAKVFSALAAKQSHIPYRDSKLTRLLQDSLGGHSKTLMFVQISPSESDLRETIGSLDFAAQVRGVELGPAKKKKLETGKLQKSRLLESGVARR